MKALLLVLGLVLPLRAQMLPGVSPGTALHPTLMGSLGDPSSPVSLSLDRVASGLAPFAGPDGFDYAGAALRLEALRQGEPLDRLSAGLLSRALSEPETMEQLLERTGAGPESPLYRLKTAASAPTPGKPEAAAPLAKLAEAARTDLDAQALFDGGAQGRSGAEGLEIRKGKIYRGGEKLGELGRGGFGVVYANPDAEGQVVKVTELSFEAAVFAGAGSAREVHDSDVAATRHLAAAGLGPRLLADARIGGSPAAVKERIYGRTVQDLIHDRAYGPEQHALVMDLIARMADKRVRVKDMNPANLMIGRTLTDPAVRAWHIDGGAVGEVAPHETAEQLRESIYHQAALFKQRMDRTVGMIATTVSLSTMLEDGLRRHGEKTAWQRFKGFLKSAYLGGAMPAK